MAQIVEAIHHGRLHRIRPEATLRQLLGVELAKSCARPIRRTSARKLIQILEVFQRARVGQGIDVLHWQAVYDVSYGELGQLAGERARDVGDCHDLRRNVAGCCVGADGVADLLLQRIVERECRFDADEQDDPYVTLPILPDGQCLDDLFEAFDGCVDFGCADAYTTGVQHSVGSPVDDDAVVLCDGGVVAVMPDAGKAFEVGGAILGAVRVVPEADRHRRKWLRAHQLAAVAADGLAGVVEDVYGHTQGAALNLAAVHGADRATAGKARHDVSAAGDGGQQHIGLDGLVYEVESVRQQRRSGGQHGSQLAEIDAVDRNERAFLQGGQIFGTRAEYRNALFLGDSPQNSGVGVERAAVVQNQRRADCQPADEPVPHHPAAGGEVEQSVGALHIGVEQVLLLML